MAAVDVLGFMLVFCLSIHGLLGAEVWTSEGGSAVLPCGITYDPAAILFWQLQPVSIIILLKHPDGTIELLEKQWEGRVDFVDGKNLRIRNVSRQDDSAAVAGGYRCSQGSTVGETSQLNVRYPPSRIAVTGYNSSSPLQPGAELQLFCTTDDSNPAPSYAWYRNGIRIGDDRTLNINPVKLENNGDNIWCKARVYDQNSPVYDWDGESERITLSVTDEEPDDDTTVGGSGDGVDVGLAVGLSVAAVVGLVIIALLAVIVRRIRNRLPPIQDPPITNGNGVSAVTSGGATGTGGGSGEGSGTDPENRPLTNGDIPMGPLPAEEVHVENEDSGDDPATVEFVDEHVGPPARPEDNAEPDLIPTAAEGPGESTQDGPVEQPPTHPSNGAGATLPFPVTESGAGRPTQPESNISASSTVWPDIFDILGKTLRTQYRSALARALGLSEPEISVIEEDFHQKAREKLHQVLVLWREQNPAATPETLAAALRRCKCDAVADEVEERWLQSAADRR